MNNITRLITGAALLVAYAGSASALTIAPTMPPSDVAVMCDASAYPAANGGPDDNFLTYCGVTATQVYKNDQPSTESGALAGDYTSVLNGDLSGGTITWDGPDFLLCSAGNNCYLLVKDGATSPYRYLFNLTGIWDGQETLTLSGFWPGTGAISHWALYGGIGTGDDDDDDDDDTDLPEPGTLGLLGLGLLGVGLSRRRKA